MDFKKYFYEEFPDQLRKLQLSRPSKIVRREIMEDENVLFFGGRNWEHASRDLQRIPNEDRPKFVLALFMIIISDQCIHAHFKESYHKWRMLTEYPKFGWSGFGYQMENPMKILWIPEEKSLVEVEKVIALIPDFVSFFKQEVERYMGKYLPAIKPDSFFEAIWKDEDFSFDEGKIIKALKTELGD